MRNLPWARKHIESFQRRALNILGGATEGVNVKCATVTGPTHAAMEGVNTTLIPAKMFLIRVRRVFVYFASEQLTFQKKNCSAPSLFTILLLRHGDFPLFSTNNATLQPRGRMECVRTHQRATESLTLPFLSCYAVGDSLRIRV